MVKGSLSGRKCVFVGNPGVGKSTLLNCLMLSKNPQLAKDGMFKSGVSIVKGLTYKLVEKTVDGTLFMDTPGLEDAKMRKQAAEAITMALRKNGFYQVVFVVTLEAGRMRPQDVTVINLVLKSAKEIRHYGVIFNKLSNGLCKKINACNESKAKLIAQVTLQEGDNTAQPFPLFLTEIEELEDIDDVTADIPALKLFMQKLPYHDIHVQNVEKIEPDKFEKYLQELEKLRELKENRELMIQKEKEEKRKYDEKIEKQRREDKIRRKQELKIQEQNAERARVIMLEKEQERRKHLEKLRNEEAERNAKRVAELQEQERQQIEEKKRQHQEQLAQQERMRSEMNARHVAEVIAANNRHRHNNECVIL